MILHTIIVVHNLMLYVKLLTQGHIAKVKVAGGSISEGRYAPFEHMVSPFI